MATSASTPFLNMRFRVEVDGLRETGAVEVVFPEARLSVGARPGRRARYGILYLRRGIGRSDDWFAWWDEACQARRALTRNVTVTLLDESGAAVHRWMFRKSRPVAYSLSKLNALGNEALIETIELAVGGFEMSAVSAVVGRRRARR